MKQTLTYILSFLFTLNGLAQVNLVPNGSFEEYTQCPDNQGQLERAIGWVNPTSTTPDYFNTCSTDNNFLIPINYYGSQNPHSGNAYVGIALYVSFSINIREYIQCQLNSDLDSNKTYCVEFFMSLPEKSTYAYTNNVSINFSNFQPTDYTGGAYGNPLSIQPNIEFADLITDTLKWIKFSGLYTASGGEKYLTIGNLQLDNTTNFTPSNLIPSPYIYVYIDDVSVTECPAMGIIPNVFTPNGDQVNETFTIENLPASSNIVIYNRWGNIVYQSDNYQNNWDGENHPDGVYYYILTMPNGETKHGTITILRN